MTPVWQTTVDELLRSFLQALNSLIPTLQRARILDESLVGYDDWARVTDVLYRVLVVEPIRSSLGTLSEARFDLPMYDTEYESYEDFSLIRVAKLENNHQVDMQRDCFFMRFLSSDMQENEFTFVETFQLDAKHQLIETSFARQAVADCYFTAVVPTSKGWEILDTITVKME